MATSTYTKSNPVTNKSQVCHFLFLYSRLIRAVVEGMYYKEMTH